MTSTRFDGENLIVTFGSQGRYLGAAIKGAPYSAEQSIEHVQTLADGTHIKQPNNGQKMWRDSEGRTRTERPMNYGMQADAPTFAVVEIRDPVAGFSYVLDDTNKIAHRVALAPPPAPRQRTATTATRPASVNSLSGPEKLGSKNIEGVIAEGTRFSNTIPIGAQGNDRPMTTTNESWFSQELKAMVLSVFSDPRNGETTTRLFNISRSEPDPSLFMPPADYTVVDEKDSFTITIKKQ